MITDDKVACPVKYDKSCSPFKDIVGQKRVDRMKFILLFLLLFWNHARGHWLRCSTGVVVTNQAINLPSSTHAGAKVSLLRKYQAPSLIYCLEECCSGKYGACSIVEYQSKSTDVNCLYYSCQPIPKCKFMDSEGTDSFTFPLISQNVSSTYNVFHNSGKDTDKLKEQSVTESTVYHQVPQRTSKNRERAVTARKGVESTTVRSEGSLVPWEVSTISLEGGESSKSVSTDHTRTVTARKGVSTMSGYPNEGSSVSSVGLSTVNMENGVSLKSFDAATTEDILSKTDSSFKNDNTTIKPRKGVDPEGELVTVRIKPRKGVEAMHPLQDINGQQITRSKVKPRKGVVPLPLSTTTLPVMNIKTSSAFVSKSNTVNNDVATYISSKNFNDTTSHVTQPSDLMSVLEQVFRDESNTPGVKLKFSYNTHSPATSASNIFTVSSIPVSSVSYNEYTTVPLYSAVTEQNSVSALTESITMPFPSILPSKTWAPQETAMESTPPLITVTENVKLQSESPSQGSVEILSTSRIPVLQTSLNVEYSASRVESTHHYNSVSRFTVSSPNKTKKPLASTVDDAENERKYKSSMHLVLSLVFGLLVLFVVLGAVAKRVYDVWMRRHYHRMDFLIDGMYDGFS